MSGLVGPPGCAVGGRVRMGGAPEGLRVRHLHEGLGVVS